MARLGPQWLKLATAGAESVEYITWFCFVWWMDLLWPSNNLS